MKSARVLVPILVSQLPKKVSAIGPLLFPARPGGKGVSNFGAGAKLDTVSEANFGSPFGSSAEWLVRLCLLRGRLVGSSLLRGVCLLVGDSLLRGG